MVDINHHQGVTTFKGQVTYRSVRLQVYNFMVDGMLIDTNTIQLLDQLIPIYEEYPFDCVAITHAHEDHTGTARWIEQNLRVPIYIHPKSIEACKQEANYPKYRQLVWGHREPFHPKPMGEEIHSRNLTWKTIYTPGHATDHLALYNSKKKILFSGDLFVTPKPRVIMASESVPDLITSLKKVLTFDFQGVFCCHAGYLPNGRDLIQQKLDYLLEIQEKIINLDENGWGVDDIDQQVFPYTPPIAPFSGYDWDSKHIVKSILQSPCDSSD